MYTPQHFASLDALFQWAKREVGARRNAVMNDVAVCMLPVHPTAKPLVSDTMGLGAALFPAIIACCACLEALAAFEYGKAGSNGPNSDEIASCATKYCGYSELSTRALFSIFRHKIAHLFAPGPSVICKIPDHRGQIKMARMTWAAYTNDPRNHLVFLDSTDQNWKSENVPWPLKPEYCFMICVKSLQTHVAAAADNYLTALRHDDEMQRNFETAMVQIYPRLSGANVQGAGHAQN